MSPLLLSSNEAREEGRRARDEACRIREMEAAIVERETAVEMKWEETAGARRAVQQVRPQDSELFMVHCCVAPVNPFGIWEGNNCRTRMTLRYRPHEGSYQHDTTVLRYGRAAGVEDASGLQCIELYDTRSCSVMLLICCCTLFLLWTMVDLITLHSISRFFGRQRR